MNKFLFCLLFFAFNKLLSIPQSCAEFSNDMSASIVLGPPDFNSIGANMGGRFASSLSTPTGIYVKEITLSIFRNWAKALSSEVRKVVVTEGVPTKVSFGLRPSQEYLVAVYDAQNHEDRTGVGKFTIEGPKA